MAGFGTTFASQIAKCEFSDGEWHAVDIQPLADLRLHPGAHVLHYGSSCFEGLKAYRQTTGSISIFRLDRHVARMRNSARLLQLPMPDTNGLAAMITNQVRAVREEVPDYPASLYLRPVLIGTEANIGKAAMPSKTALLYILASPVGNYFESGERPLRLWVEDQLMRTTPELGEVKTGGNYAAALRHITTAKSQRGVDQVLFCPGGDVQETGAANFLLINDTHIVTKRLDGSVLPGITRASIIELAQRAGYRVEERDIQIGEMLEFIKNGEAALSGTAATLTPVGSLLYRNEEHQVGDGGIGPNTIKLRQLLGAIHSGQETDLMGWVRPI